MLDDIFTDFYEESKKLLNEVQQLALQLKGTDIPDDRQSKILVHLLQRFHRLIGGLASIGFSMFSPISRKTSLLAEKSIAIHGASIKDLMTNLSIAVTDISFYFISSERLKEIEAKAAAVDRRIEACMSYISVKNPHITTQDEVDDIMKMFGKV